MKKGDLLKKVGKPDRKGYDGFDDPDRANRGKNCMAVVEAEKGAT